MPQLTVEGVGEFEVPADKRLILALTDDAKTDQLHACGGFARCTTCRVEFAAGEPDRITQAEKDVLTSKGLLGKAGLRLSCQLVCENDMTVRVVSRLKDAPTRVDAGKRPGDAIAPDPVWVTK